MRDLTKQLLFDMILRYTYFKNKKTIEKEMIELSLY